MTFLVIIIILALIFDYINGFHDAANSIATIVSTKVLTPFQAVLWAALFNFAAFFISKYLIGEFKIGNTIANSVNKDFITLEVIFSGLIGAIAGPNLAARRRGAGGHRGEPGRGASGDPGRAFASPTAGSRNTGQRIPSCVSTTVSAPARWSLP